MFLLILIAIGSLPVVAASVDDDKQNVRVLYLGNDYYQDENGNWMDANRFIIEALESSYNIHFTVEHVPPISLVFGYRDVALDFDEFDVVIFSEVWLSHFTDDQLSSLQRFLRRGGGFIMFGGWGSYGGHPPYGGWDGSVVEKMLPVKIRSNDDAVDMDFRMKPKGRHQRHPILRGLNWKEAPLLNGYNDVAAEKKKDVLAVNSQNEHPILVVGKYWRGRTVAFASNPAGGWGMDFVEWSSYDRFIIQTVVWSAHMPEIKNDKH